MKLFSTIYLSLSFYLLSCGLVFSQQRFELSIKFSPKDSKTLARISYATSFQDSTEGVFILQDILIKLREKSFLASSFDSLYWKDSTLYASLDIGKKYQWIELRENKTEELKLKKQKNRENHHKNNRSMRYV